MPETSLGQVRTFAVSAVAAGLAIVFFWTIADILLLLGAGILLAVFWRGLARVLSRRGPLSEGWGFALVVLVSALLAAAGLLFYVPLAADGLDQMASDLPEALRGLAERLSHYDWGRRLLSRLAETETWSGVTSEAFSRLTGIFSTALGAITASLVILITGLYLGAEPQVYLNGFVRLFPSPYRARLREIFDALEYSLDWWLIGRIASMTVVGALTWLGLTMLGVPLALTLAILAALLSFVPNLGPILSAVPAVLVGLSESPYTALSVAGLYVLVQTVESYFITPLIQRRAVLLPPALVLTMQLVFGLLFGFLGLLLATPLTVILVVLIKMVYLEDRLGEEINLP